MGAGDTTEREDAAHGASSQQLVLDWVWPERRRIRLQGARLSIGRDPAVEISIQGSGVSRQHAELNRQGPIYALRDCGSTNATWLDGKRIDHAAVRAGAILRTGEWVGVFDVDAETSPSNDFFERAPGLLGGNRLGSALAPLQRAAAVDLPLLVVGETGTGKERVARAAHGFSGRGPFLAVNCAAVPEQLAEAELFGYRRGAFTGAERASVGYFRAAHGGTLFLDEIAELPLILQAKLLRVLEQREVLGLGESTPVAVDVRIVSASQRPLKELVAEGRFRNDLAARLAGITIELPSLRERRADVASLFGRFLRDQRGAHPPRVDSRLVEALCLHDWPQNVRELELATRALLAIHGQSALLQREHLPAELLRGLPAATERPSSLPASAGRRGHDLARLQEELRSNGGQVSAAAEAIGISRQRVYRLLDGKSPQEFGADASRVSEDDH